MTFRWQDLWYMFVIFFVQMIEALKITTVATFYVVIDNYLIIILILLVCVGVRIVWRARKV